MRAGACVQCEGPGIAYIIASLLFVLTWFPVLRLILTRYVKSFYTSIAFVQFMGLYASFAVPWSSNLKSLFAGLGSVNLNLDAIYVSCSTGGGGMSFSNVWLVQMLLPLLYPAAVIIHLVAGRALTHLAAVGAPPSARLIRLGWRPRRDFSWEQLVSIYLPPGLFFLNMYLIMGVGTSLRMLACVNDHNGGQYLRADPQVQCWQGSHLGQAVGAVIGCCLYLGVMPAIYCWVLFYVVPSGGRNSRMGKAYRFLYDRFDPSWHWWELMEMLRKVVFVVVSIFGAGEGLEQSAGALAAVVVLMIADMLCHPYISNTYDVLEEILAFVEFMVLLLGMVALNSQTQEGGWHEPTAWIMLFFAFVTIAYVALIDLDSVWQLRRVRKLCRRHNLVLQTSLFQLDAFNSLLIDWLYQASPKALHNFGELEKQLNRAVYSGALKDTSRTKQYEAQLTAIPFLLDNICSLPFSSLPTEAWDDVLSINELLRKYLRIVSTQPDDSSLPGHCFFRQNVRGALTCWLAQPHQLESRVLMCTFLRDIAAYAEVQAAGLSVGVRVNKLLISAGVNASDAAAQRDAIAKAKEAPKSKQKGDAADEELLSKRSTLTDMVLTIDPAHSEMQKAIHTLLMRLIVELKCEIVEVVPADETAPSLVAAQVVHPSVMSVRRQNLKSSTAWNRDPSNPLGLCVTTRETVFVDCALQDDRFNLPYAIGEISQVYVPIFSYKRLRLSELMSLSAAQISSLMKVNSAGTTAQGNPEEEKGGVRLIGVLRCANKFSRTSSRAGFAFEADDARCVASFASLIAERTADELRKDLEVLKLQRAARRFRKLEELRNKAELAPAAPVAKRLGALEVDAVVKPAGAPPAACVATAVVVKRA